MRVIVNSKGSGDWVLIQTDEGETVFEGHRITPQDFCDIINSLGGVGKFREDAGMVHITDEQMEEGDY